MNSLMCPCGNNKLYLECCSIFIEHNQQPETAQQLMRARYSAYVRHDINYLLDTWHHSTRPSNINPDDLQLTKWNQLFIIDISYGLKQHNSGKIEFVAYFSTINTNEKLHEISRFVKEQNKWFYVDGKIIQNSNFQPGRNSLCYCGSGKKYKHCCLNK
ncbi:MAG: YchJ family protein [Thiohalomonadales bacterium]